MRRVIETLNEMSFDLPDGFFLTSDKYSLDNGQGFINTENYLSESAGVISLFEVHRDPDEFFVYYDSLVKDLTKVTGKSELKEQLKLRVGDFVFPTYVIRGFSGKVIYTVQVFVNCGDCLGCFMISLDDYKNFKTTMKESPLLSALVKLLRSVE